MRTVRLPLLRGALFIIALAAISILLARADNPAQATTYNPSNFVSVSDPSPGAAADIIIDFSVDAPDSFPNVKTQSSIQFIPRQWGIHTPATDGADAAPIGSIAGTFNALTNLGLFGLSPCSFPIPVPFTLYDATVDTTRLASALDIGGDAHPGGLGYSGQFAQDPLTVQAPGDLGLALRAFNANEKYDGQGGQQLPFGAISTAYRDDPDATGVGVGVVSVGDVRLTAYSRFGEDPYAAGTAVQADDRDVISGGMTLYNFGASYKHDNADGNLQMDTGENIYQDRDGSNTVSYGDIRLFWFGQLGFQSVVENFQLPGGVFRYPDFLNQMFPPSVVGEPLARQFGAYNVLDMTAVALNIVTYRPGQLPGYPASLGYPNVVVLMNPVAPIEAFSINVTSDLCTPLSLTSTNFGLTKDNPTTAANEAGFVRLTNPTGPGEKDHKFTLVTTSQPDADDDGIENMLDSCPLTPNIHDLDGRNNGAGVFDFSLADPDNDGLDGACDPQESPPPDLGRSLIAFNPNEKSNAGTCWCSGLIPAVYRDTDGNSLVSPGDERLSVRQIRVNWQSYYVQPGIVQDTDADYRNPVTGAVHPNYGENSRVLNSLRDGWYPVGHTEDVAENGRYDVGETMYQDSDRSGDVSVGDGRGLVNGEYFMNFSNHVVYEWPSPLSPAFYMPDEDLDNYGNRADNCPLIANGIELLDLAYQQVPGFTFWWGITGALIGPDNQADTDGDDIGDACDPNPDVIDGHMHVVTLTQKMTFERHGIKLNDVSGPQKVKDSGARTYSVDVSNLSGSDSEDIQVRLRVFGCGTVDGAPGQNTAVVSVAPGGSGTADFTVDWTGCPAGLGPDAYIIEADACHAGDAAPAGFVGSGASCPGASDGKADPNPLDDAYMTIDVEVGTTP